MWVFFSSDVQEEFESNEKKELNKKSKRRNVWMFIIFRGFEGILIRYEGKISYEIWMFIVFFELF